VPAVTNEAPASDEWGQVCRIVGAPLVTLDEPIDVTVINSPTVTLDEPVGVLIKDGSDREASLDPFERLRVSSPTSLFDSKQIYDESPLFFVTDLTTGGTATHVQNKAATELKVTGTTGSKAIRQTKRYFNYQPGKGLLLLFTQSFVDQAANIRRQAGYYDAANGIFMRQDGSAISWVRRYTTDGNPVAEEVFTKANWSVDPLDGSGPSGKTLDITKTQIGCIDLQWLGVGTVRVGFVIDGKAIYVHEFHHANSEPVVYMQTPNLPIRWEIENLNSGAANSRLDSICCSAMVEGSTEQIGISRSADRGITGTTVGGTLRPIISIRLKSSHNRATVIPDGISFLAAGSGSDIYWALILNPTITGGTAASWTSLTNSAIEFDVAQDGAASLGTVIDSGYGAKNNEVQEAINSVLSIASDFGGTSDILSLCVQKIGGGTDTLYGAISWLEAL
jgi:hypothetical protein